MAQVEYELIRKLQDKWVKSNAELASLPIIQAHYIKNNTQTDQNGGNANRFLVTNNIND